MNLKRIAATACMSAGMLAVLAVPAYGHVGHGKLDPVCEPSDTFCMNDWNGGGSGASVKLYASGNSNEVFSEQAINPCNSTPKNEVTGTCPFTTGTGLNSTYLGDTIVQIKYTGSGNGSGLCVAAGSGGSAILGTCNNSNGSGGANGTIQVQDSVITGVCAPPWYGLVNRYYSNSAGSAEFVTLQSLQNGATIDLNDGSAEGCWKNF
jgi:hypothetical protein